MSEALDWYEKAAKQSHPAAQFQLGLHLEVNRDRSNTSTIAYDLFKRAALAGHPDAQFRVARLVKDGITMFSIWDRFIHVFSDLTAVGWLQRAAKSGQANAQYELGLQIEAGSDGLSKDKEKPFELFQQAAKQGHADAQFRVGLHFLTEKQAGEDPKKAIDWLTKAGKQGHADAQLLLGRYFAESEKDLKTACSLFIQAAEKNNSEALNLAGDCYKNGTGGLRKNYQMAFKLYLQAAECGSAVAQFKVAEWYRSGSGGVVQSDDEALRWFRRAAEQDFPPAISAMGYCYGKGKGVEKNAIEAIEWYRRAAEMKHPEAYRQLGYCYESGFGGVEKDVQKAFSLYLQAAELGDSDAQFVVALKFKDGVGVAKNLEESFAWMKKAADQGKFEAQLYIRK